ncbi:antibiotic biosynthesis monooxygenase family protein [Methylobacterium sp. B1]|uniref:antibiotic biosynthesis monooxygenase family protein n=1 Tax=Methylobacterium sp. B1 TaxID=91459 RepID=UPI00034C608E|nr:antibiotic biosynthesis monooxygenase family protein [Methylobacterium sp. B1]
MIKFVEMDAAVSVGDQLKEDDGNPVVLINTFTVPPEDTDALLAAWGRDAAVMKCQPGFISTQLHRGIAGSHVFLNYAVWQSVGHFRAAFGNPEFQAELGNYPASATASPHLFRKMEVPGICTA